MKEFTNWDAVLHPVPDVSLDILPGAFGSGAVPGQWTHGGDVASGTNGAIGSWSVVGHTTGGDRHTRASGSGIVGEPRTLTFEIVGAADVGS